MRNKSFISPAPIERLHFTVLIKNDKKKSIRAEDLSASLHPTASVILQFSPPTCKNSSSLGVKACSNSGVLLGCRVIPERSHNCLEDTYEPL